MNDATRPVTLRQRIGIAVIGAILVAGAALAASLNDRADATTSPVLDNGAHLLSTANITPEQAVEIALRDTPGQVDEVDLELAGDELIYEVEIDDTPVYVDAIDGSLVVVEFDNDEDIATRDKSESDDAPR
jgi:uncharacterized membrane protein YkoI